MDLDFRDESWRYALLPLYIVVFPSSTANGRGLGHFAIIQTVLDAPAVHKWSVEAEHGRNRFCKGYAKIDTTHDVYGVFLIKKDDAKLITAVKALRS